MSLGGVFMTDTDGNIGREISSLTEKVCGLLFDVSAQSDIWNTGVGATLKESLKDTVIEINSLEDADKLGLTPYSGEANKDFLHGIPYYHIKHFFTLVGGSGRLFIMFADCSQNWNALVDMQKASNGIISQFGVWTEKSLWKKMDEASSQYSIALVGDLQSVAEDMANNYNAPASMVLCANSAQIETGSGKQDTVVWSEIPTCVINARYVTVLLGQGMDSEVSKMQMALDSKTPVGTVGAALGCLARAAVSESIGWVEQFDLISYFPDIEFGFGDVSIADGQLKSTTKYSSLSSSQLDTLEELGYVFLVKYAGLEGHVYFSGDTTCSNGDYRTLSRNRTINKSRRLVRTALLPYVNSPIRVDPNTGQLSSAQITMFSNLIRDMLTGMQNAGEISGFSGPVIPATQNILQNDTLLVQYQLIPVGTAKYIKVTEGLTLKQ